MVKISVVVFQVVMPYHLVGGYEHFGEIYCISSEGGGCMFLQNVGSHLKDYMAIQPTRPPLMMMMMMIVFITSYYKGLAVINNLFSYTYG